MWQSQTQDRSMSAARDTCAPVPCPEAADKADKTEVLRDIEILGDLAAWDIELLLNDVPTRAASKGTVFYGAGEPPEGLFLLKTGKVELYRQSHGRRLTLGIVKEGSFFGEMSLVGQPAPATYAEAVVDSAAFLLSRGAVQSLIRKRPEVAIRVFEVLTGRLQEAWDSLEEMAFNDVTGRVSSLLLKLAGPSTDVIEGYSHRELASMVGCLRESLTVTLDRLKRSDALTIGRRRIEITDRSKLKRVVSQRYSVLPAR